MPLSRRPTKASIKKSLQKLRFHKELPSRSVTSDHVEYISGNEYHPPPLRTETTLQKSPHDSGKRELVTDCDGQESSEDSDDSTLTYVGSKSWNSGDTSYVPRTLAHQQGEIWIPPEQVYLMQNESVSPSADLCESCSQLNLEAIARGDGRAGKDARAFSLQTLGTINRTWFQRTCRLCRFFADIWELHKSYLRGASSCLVLLSSLHLSKYAGSDQIRGGQYHRPILLLSHPQPERSFDVDSTTLDNLDVVGPIFIKGCQTTGSNISARVIDAHRVDFSIIKAWLRICATHHGSSCCTPTASNLHGLQLLNCKTGKLEPYTPGARFVALSYVWGANVDDQRNQDVVQNKCVFPQTIQDALTVTAEIGFQYLWVDRYCIPQLDEQAKHLQIASMDLIYNRATLTIIAACGQDSSSGLPGISRCRVTQPNVTVGDYHLISGLSSPVVDVRNSTWMGRGWTYQEALLSKRRLIFTEKQVYFECEKSTFMETLTEPEDSMSTFPDESLEPKALYDHIGVRVHVRHRLFPSDFLGQIEESPWLIQHRIAEYTTRSLTYESDTLSAFLGVLRQVAAPGCTVSHIWGVPVLWSSPEWSSMEGFATGLCWVGFFPTTQFLERRPGFPSWSWAGWRMPISPKSNFYRYGFKMPYEIKIAVETEDGQVSDWATFQGKRQISLSKNSSVPSQFLHIECWSLRCSLFAPRHFAGFDKALDTKASLRSHWSLRIWGSSEKLHNVVMHKQYSNREWGRRKLDIWTILIIGNTQDPIAGGSLYYEQSPPFGPFFMIVEDIGSHFERVGYLDLAHSSLNTGPRINLSRHLVDMERRSFRLG
ncbi:hypothetical protein ONS96_001861 [Cadophora gregata f. sp. sojae]|nr:hypothetical protein ONS96_001861 [Cadophora gregata f. sp. sojae]